MYISAFKRKNEISKEALEMIRKYGVDIECKVLSYKLGHWRYKIEYKRMLKK